MMYFPLESVYVKEQGTKLGNAGRQLARLTHKVSDSSEHHYWPSQLMIQASFFVSFSKTIDGLRIRLQLWELRMVNPLVKSISVLVTV